MNTKEFNIIEEPWIMVLSQDYQIHEVSIKDALINSHNYICISGEIPQQDLAVSRVLLAILYATFVGKETSQCAEHYVHIWKKIWENGKFPEEPILKYLDIWKDRFWLFHPERPFFQTPEAVIGTYFSAAKLNGEVSESAFKKRLFSNYSGEGKEYMSYSQAARWLLFINSYDDASVKKKGGKDLPTIGTGWLGKITSVYFHWDNLFQTLMLNFALLKDGNALWGINKPCWEFDECRVGERTQIDVPDNPAELLTVQSRRILLTREGEKVTGFNSMGGDFFEKENAFSEQMAVWELSKDNDSAFLPLKYRPYFNVWNFLESILGDDSNELHSPGMIKWLNVVSDLIGIEFPNQLSLQTVGIVYGNRDMSIRDFYSEKIPVEISLFRNCGKEYRAAICDEIKKVKEMQYALYSFVSSCFVASGKFPQVTWDSTNTAKELVDNFVSYEIDTILKGFISNFVSGKTSMLEFYNKIDLLDSKLKEIGIRATKYFAAEYSNGNTRGKIIKKMDPKTGEVREFDYSVPKECNICLARIKKIFNNEEELK